MKKLITILLIAGMFVACEKLCPEYPEPKGVPDDITEYNSSGYESITYIYYCRDGQYQSITWTRTERCGTWSKSKYTSSCIK